MLTFDGPDPTNRADRSDDYAPSPPPSTGAYERAQGRGVIYNANDPLMSRILVGTRGIETYDSRMNKVADQLGETYDGTTTEQPRFKSILDLLQGFDNFSHKEFLRFRNMLAAAGYSSDSAAPVEVKAAYAQMLDEVAQLQAKRINVTPTQYLNNLIRLSGMDPSKVASGKRKQWKQTNTSKTIYELDPAEARSLMTQTIQQFLGRDPTKSELQDFMNAVQTKSEDDPRVTQTTTQYTRGGKDSETTSSVLDSGYTNADAMEEAEEMAKEAPGYAQYQAVSTYFPEFERLLGAPV